jgi:hypothetical protein
MRFHLASEAAHVLYDDCANTVAFNPVQQSGEARSVFDCVGPTDRGIVKLTDELELMPIRFLFKVKQGVYPSPCREQGILPKWHRAKLDQAIARRHGLLAAGDLLTEDIAGLI